MIFIVSTKLFVNDFRIKTYATIFHMNNLPSLTRRHQNLVDSDVVMTQTLLGGFLAVFHAANTNTESHPHREVCSSSRSL